MSNPAGPTPPRASLALAQGFAAIGHFYIHFFTAIYFVIVLALEKEWNQPYGELIGLWTVGSALVGFGALPAGWLGDRWSARGMMVLFFVGIGTAAILCGFTHGPFWLAAGLAGIGLFASIYHPVGIAWLVRNARQQGKALGFNGIFRYRQRAWPPRASEPLRSSARSTAHGGLWASLR